MADPPVAETPLSKDALKTMLDAFFASEGGMNYFLVAFWPGGNLVDNVTNATDVNAIIDALQAQIIALQQSQL